jgi:hypothetical protein
MADVLVPHPYAFLTVDRPQGVPDQVRLYCPVPGEQLRETHVRKHPDADLFALLLQIAEEQTLNRIECSEEQADFLMSVGFLVAAEDVAQITFPCTLDYPLLDGLPKRIQQPKASAKGVVVNPTLAAERENDVVSSHLALAARRLFPAQRVWLDDPRTGQRVPFGRSPFTDRLLERGTEYITELDDARAITLLLMAGAVTDPEAKTSVAESWSRTIDAAHDSFARDRYCTVRDVIPPLQLAALRLHYRSLLAKGCFALGDSQVERRFWKHQDRIARFYHQLLTPLTSRIAGRPLKPSYSYFASYLPGAVLKRHVDREQCEISISLLIDYSPDPDDVSDWPIFVESPSNPGRVVAIEQGPGDALFYKGCEVPHHREALAEGRTSTSLFFHYVPVEFTSPLD